jgi:hypothetical protein
MASDLLYVDVRRTLHRYHAEGLLSTDALALCIGEFHALLAAIDQVPMSRQILDRAAGPLPAPVRTLDAIHLATAIMWAETNQEEVVFFTHDRQLATAARVCGLQVYPQLV